MRGRGRQTADGRRLYRRPCPLDGRQGTYLALAFECTASNCLHSANHTLETCDCLDVMDRFDRGRLHCFIMGD